MMAEEDSGQSPFSRPGFVVSAIALALVCGMGLALVFMPRSQSQPSSAGSSAAGTQTSVAPVAPSGSASGSQESVCGLPDPAAEKTRLTSAPAVDEWRFHGAQDALPYPTSAEFGPGASEAGYDYCFQRSPEGALFAATNLVTLIGDPNLNIENFLKYYVVNPDDVTARPDSPKENLIRMSIEGFRLLEYSQDQANIEIAFHVTINNDARRMSSIQKLVWDGDWKLSDVRAASVSEIPSFSGYIPWSED